MSEILGKLMLYMGYPFVRHAFIVGILIALCSSLLGVTLVLRRYSFIGDGLSHVAFFAAAVAGLLGFSQDMFLSLAVTVFSAVVLMKSGGGRRISGDAGVAVLSVGSLALGYLLLNIFSSSSNLSADVCGVLFGSTSILTLSVGEVWLSLVLSVSVVTVFVLFYNRIFAVTFDSAFATASGLDAGRYNTLVAVIVAVIIVLSMNLVGSLLISALIIFPAISAMCLFESFLSVTVCSAVLSVAAAATGLVISILAGTPVGSTIVAADAAAFVIFYLTGMVKGRKK